MDAQYPSRRDFETLYRVRLAVHEEDHVHARRRIRWITGIFVALGLLPVAGGVALGMNLGLRPGLLVAAGGIALLWFVYKAGFWDPFRRDFKQKFVRPLAQEFGLTYGAGQSIPRRTFDQSQLFAGQSYNRYAGEDYFGGKLGATDMEFSELRVQRESGSGKRKTVVTVFRGLFISADFHKNFRARTFVLPDSLGALGGVGTFLQSINVFQPGKLVKLEDVEFERAFAVYADDPLEARYLLTPLLMERLLAYKRATGATMRASFVNSRVFLALSGLPDLFEPKIWNAPPFREECRALFRDIDLFAGVVEALNLNTRIWTKR
jgi:hypothetical protein